ncbi:MAG: hypothetical protein IAI48_09770, partial [Candidatus Eremiobacteraeota bacterium]|nr:hypothetical protein [Candidatus Eremiobacteraeota bacterium]
MSATTRLAWLVAVVVIVLPIAVSLRRHHALGDVYSGEAFAVFYCAGEAVRERRDPYLVEPLRTCEARAHVIPPNVVEPAPLPPPPLGFFAALSVLPYAIASALWALVLVASFLVAGASLVRLAPRVPPLAIWTALLPGVLYFNVYYGEIPTLVAGALAAAALALRSGRIVPAVACVTIAALFEPHVGGAAWLGVFIVAPRARLALVAALGLAVLG